MARTPVDDTQWTLVTTTTVETCFSAEKGPIRLQTGSTTGVDDDDGLYLHQWGAIVLPSGLDVSARSVVTNAVVQTIKVGT